MEQTIFFVDKYVTFSSSSIENYDLAIDSRADTIAEISRAKVIDFFEKYNSILFLCNTPSEAYSKFCSEFSCVEAAGGVVTNGDGEMLMIHRNSRWDLPKGHLERGETLEQCALREVEEETGVGGLTLGRKLMQTQHAYIMKGVWELKTTHWWAMSSDSRDTKAQREEGIDQVKWCSPIEVATALESSYPTIRAVFDQVNA